MERASRMNDKWSCRSSSDMFWYVGLDDGGGGSDTGSIVL
jgi:hypothetical protein